MVAELETTVLNENCQAMAQGAQLGVARQHVPFGDDMQHLKMMQEQPDSKQ